MAGNSSNDPGMEGLGFSISPNADCPHIASSTFEISKNLFVANSEAEGKAPRRNLYEENCRCATCNDKSETWVCLTCSLSACSRYKAGHMVDHTDDKDNEHSTSVIAISLADLSVWCFACNEYITHPKLEPLFQEFHLGKFGALPTDNLHAPGNADGAIMRLLVEGGS